MTEDEDNLVPLGNCSHGNPIHYRFPCEECMELNAVDLGMDDEDREAVNEHVQAKRDT